eukprot:6184545-Pleurochrysis_carterae.AAC.2
MLTNSQALRVLDELVPLAPEEAEREAAAAERKKRWGAWAQPDSWQITTRFDPLANDAAATTVPVASAAAATRTSNALAVPTAARPPASKATKSIIAAKGSVAGIASQPVSTSKTGEVASKAQRPTPSVRKSAAEKEKTAPKVPAAKVEKPGAKVQKPAAMVQKPVQKAENPVKTVKTSAGKVEKPAAKVEKPAAKAGLPSSRVEKSSERVDQQSAKSDEPPSESGKFGAKKLSAANAPSGSNSALSSVAASLDEVAAELDRALASAAAVDTDTRSIPKGTKLARTLDFVSDDDVNAKSAVGKVEGSERVASSADHSSRQASAKKTARAAESGTVSPQIGAQGPAAAGLKRKSFDKNANSGGESATPKKSAGGLAAMFADGATSRKKHLHEPGQDAGGGDGGSGGGGCGGVDGDSGGGGGGAATVGGVRGAAATGGDKQIVEKKPLRLRGLFMGAGTHQGFSLTGACRTRARHSHHL